MILDDARQALKTVAPDNFTIELNLVWEPAWNPSMMTEYARRCLGWDDSPDYLV
jgi:metal-sulfur cluster biosynthetic enzyme